MVLVGRKTLLAACTVSYIVLFVLFYLYMYGGIGRDDSSDDDTFQPVIKPTKTGPKHKTPKPKQQNTQNNNKQPVKITPGETQQYEFPKQQYTFWTSDFGMSSTSTFARLAYSMKQGNKHQQTPVELSLLHRGHTLDACNYLSTPTSTSKQSTPANAFVAQFLTSTCANHKPSPFSFSNAYDMSPSHDTAFTRQELWRSQQQQSSESLLNNKNIDAFWCTSPMSLCEVFMPYNKPMILYAGGSTGSGIGGNGNGAAFTMGRTHTTEKQWNEWISNIQKV